jgi:transcriptional regulator with XRE-family HTH domain
MDPSTSAGRLLTALKQQFKSKGLHYRDVAARMRVSEATVKRYVSGKGVTIAALEKLAQIVDLDLLSLAALVQEQNVSAPGVNKAQEEALGRNRLLRAVFYLLSRGWPPSQIAEEFELTREIDGILAKLQALGLIRRASANTVKVLVRPNLTYKSKGAMAEDVDKRAHQFLAEIDLRDDKCEWMYGTARLSEASAIRLKDMIKRFDSELRALWMSETALPPSQTQWYRIFIGAQPVSRKKLLAQDS